MHRRKCGLAIAAGSFEGRGAATRSTRQDEPDIEIEDDPVGVLPLVLLERKFAAILIFHGDEPRPEGADVGPARQLCLLDKF